MAWQTIRTLAAQAPEVGAPVAGDFIDLDPRGDANQTGYSQYYELRVQPLTVGASATLGIWRRSETKIDKIGTFTIAAADIANPNPIVFELHGDQICVRVDAAGGGTVSTVVQGRGVIL